jgi:hypothetical protein
MMKKIPWRGIAGGCGLLTVLVLARCVVTALRSLYYYGGMYWRNEVAQDPWLYVGMVAAAVCVAALLILSDRAEKEKAAQTEDDRENGCEE